MKIKDIKRTLENAKGERVKGNHPFACFELPIYLRRWMPTKGFLFAMKN